VVRARQVEALTLVVLFVIAGFLWSLVFFSNPNKACSRNLSVLYFPRSCVKVERSDEDLQPDTTVPSLPREL
jgi:hypothetical protein